MTYFVVNSGRLSGLGAAPGLAAAQIPVAVREQYIVDVHKLADLAIESIDNLLNGRFSRANIWLGIGALSTKSLKSSARAGLIESRRLLVLLKEAVANAARDQTRSLSDINATVVSFFDDNDITMRRYLETSNFTLADGFKMGVRNAARDAFRFTKDVVVDLANEATKEPLGFAVLALAAAAAIGVGVVLKRRG